MNKPEKISIWILAATGILFFISSCNKPEYEDNAKLTFSSSEVTFDTVFSTIGSTTQRLIVYNPNNFDITADIHLASGSNSYYSINVDGLSGIDFDDVEIKAKDSIFIHIKVTINPGNQNNPFLVTDSIVFRIGNNQQDVDLIAYGQDANFIVAYSYTGSIKYKIVAGAHETTRWTNEKPYVIYGWAAVDSLGKLIIDPGTKIYLHSGSGIWVYRYGNIEVNGTTEQPVIFRGDRKEAWFDTDYSQWDRIWINEGTEDNIINNAIVTNSFVGIQVEALSENLGNKTIITNSIIHNTENAGILAKASNLEVTNCQISNNGSYSLQLEIGNFELKHLTIANYFSQSAREDPALYISNFYKNLVANGDGTYSYVTYVGNTATSVVNSIITGILTNEISTAINESGTLDWQLENCLIKTDYTSANFVNCLRNVWPQYTDYSEQDFTLQSNSPAINAGKSGIGVDYDLLGNPRDGNPDIGAYEFSSVKSFQTLHSR
jgi:hypothetical protein